MIKRYLILSVACILAFAALSACDGNGRQSKASAENKAPDFTVETINHGNFTLSDTRGQVVLLNFWATWCPPCRVEIPHLKALYREYSDSGLVVVGASIDKMSTQELARFVATNEMEYPVFLADESMLRDYGGIRSVPTTLIIDRNGSVVDTVVGYRDKGFFEELIEGLL